ncbi:CC0125/CC1285 family lipoprotein [Actimicrobium antarcticum]|uniref:Lipoprotein n=1 Tax=Actimicrobium antarcticum TaxID=1051899 RepID=A0ABP7SUH4_9BURK
MKKLLAILMAVLLAACATPYGKYGLLGGYTDSRIDENTFSISVDNNGMTSKQVTSMQALYRAAELTVEHGFDYFVVGSTANNARSISMVTPGNSTSNTTINSYGSTALATTTTRYTPSTIVPIELPNSTLVIKAFKGVKPEGIGTAYDAKSVLKYLGPQVLGEKGK